MRATLAINGLNEDSDIFEFSNQPCGGFRNYLFYDLGYYYQNGKSTSVYKVNILKYLGKLSVATVTSNLQGYSENKPF